MTDKEALHVLTGTDVLKLVNEYDVVTMATQLAMNALADKLGDFDTALLLAIDALAEKVKRQEELERMLNNIAIEKGEDE